MDYRDVAIYAAKKAGSILLKLSKKDIAYKSKSKHDILAEGDLESENCIISTIKEYFPNHSIFSEEKGKEMTESEYLWVIDPVDGTINFANKLDEYCISIALLRNDEVILGVIYQPSVDRLYVAEKGKGATLNDKKLLVSAETEITKMLAATDMTSKQPFREQNFELMKLMSGQVRQIRIFGSCAIHLAYLAQARIDCYWKNRFNFWDYAAGILIVEESGGIVTDFAGAPITINSKDIIVSNCKEHKKIRELLSESNVTSS